MAERPTDDDEGLAPGEVTVPPWLRTGPSPDPAIPTPPADPEPAPTPRGPAEHEPTPPGAVPSRITLGARPREEGPRGQHPERDQPEPRADDLSTLPLRAAEPEPPGRVRETPTGADRAAPPRAASTPGPSRRAGATARSRPRSRAGIAVLALGGVAVVAGAAVIGYVVTRGMIDPAGDVAAGGDGACAAVEEPGRVVGAGPGSPATPAGAVLAFDHAYYVERSAAAAFEVVAESSRMSEERLRAEGIDRLPQGTTHCVEIRTVSPTLLDVTLTEYRPGGETIPLRQRVRVEEDPADGTWGIVSITPAG